MISTEVKYQWKKKKKPLTYSYNTNFEISCSLSSLTILYLLVRGNRTLSLPLTLSVYVYKVVIFSSLCIFFHGNNRFCYIFLSSFWKKYLLYSTNQIFCRLTQLYVWRRKASMRTLWNKEKRKLSSLRFLWLKWNM